MRVSLGQLSEGYTPIYPYPSPVNLIDGRLIANPGQQRATLEDCIPYQCGADNTNMAAKMWCSYWSQTATRAGCIDPECAPWRNAIPYCSLPAVAPPPILPAPSLPAPVFVPQPSPPIPTLTPQNIVPPMPDITRILAAQPPTIASCSPWCAINAWVGENPLLSVAVLAGIAVLLWPKGGRI